METGTPDANSHRAAWPPLVALAPVACVIVVGCLIGVTAILAKLATDAGAEPLSFLLWSVLGAGTILTATAVAAGHAPRLDRRTVPYFVISGLLSIALPNFLIFSAVPHVGAGFIALSFAFPPLYTYALAVFGGLEQFRMVRAAGVVVAMAGAFTLAASKSGSATGEAVWIAATLAAPVVIAIGNIYRTRHWPAGASSFSLAPGMLLGGAGLLFAGASAAGLPLAPPVGNTALATFLAAQTATFSAMYVLYFILQKMSGPVYLSQIGSVGAIAGAAAAILLLGEAAPPGLGLAAGLIAAGVVLVTTGAGRPSARPEVRHRQRP